MACVAEGVCTRTCSGLIFDRTRWPDASAGKHGAGAAAATTPSQIVGSYPRQMRSAPHGFYCGGGLGNCPPRGRLVDGSGHRHGVAAFRVCRALRAARLYHRAWRAAEVSPGGWLVGFCKRSRPKQEMTSRVANGLTMAGVVAGKSVGGGARGALVPEAAALQHWREHALGGRAGAATCRHTNAAGDLLRPSSKGGAARLSPSAQSWIRLMPRSASASGSWSWYRSRRGGCLMASAASGSSSSSAASSPSPSPERRRQRRREIELEEEMEDDLFGFLIRMYEKMAAFLSKQGGEVRQIEWPSASETQCSALLMGVLQILLQQVDLCFITVLRLYGPERKQFVGATSNFQGIFFGQTRELWRGKFSSETGTVARNYLHRFPISHCSRPVCDGAIVRDKRSVVAAALPGRSADIKLDSGILVRSWKAAGRSRHVVKMTTSGMQVGTEQPRIHAEKQIGTPIGTHMSGKADFQIRRYNDEAVRTLEEEVGKDECVFVPTENVDLPRPGGLVDGGFAYRETFLVRCYEVGVNRTASIETIANLLQEVGANHAQAAGFSTDGFATTLAMREKHLIWVTTRMHIEMIRYPLWGDVVVVESWCQPDGKVSLRRDWLLHDGGTGMLIGRVTSTWVMMNQDTRRLSKIPEEVKQELLEYCPWTPRHAISSKEGGKKVPQMQEPVDFCKSGLKVRRSDLDMNHHVNNVTYIGWMLESIPGEIHEEYELESATLEYRSECLHEDTIKSLANIEGGDGGSKAVVGSTRPLETIPNGEDGAATQAAAAGEGINTSAIAEQQSVRFTHMLVLQEDSKELSRGRTVWRRKVERDFN